MLQRLREWWLYWRYRNITRRRQLLQARLRVRLRRQPSMARAFRSRGTATYTPRRSGNSRGLIFVVVVAAVLAVVNAFLGLGATIWNWLDLVLLAAMIYAYMLMGKV